MNRHDKQIYDKIVDLGKNLNTEITSITKNNPQLIEFLESSDGSHQNLLIDSKWGSGKTYTLKLLSFGEFSKIREQLGELKDFPIIKDNIKELKSCNNISKLIEKYKELQIKTKIKDLNNSLNLNALLIQFDKYIFINLDEILYSNNWIEELYFAIAQEIWNHKVIDTDSTFKDWVKMVFNLDEKDINAWQKEATNVVKDMLPKKVQSGIRLLPLRKKYQDKIKGNYKKNINDIYELINNEERTIFVFENLERVTDTKIMEFFGQFNSIFNGFYENKNHKFIFNVDEEVLKEKLNDNYQHREKYLNKYFDQKLTLVTSDSIKTNLVNGIVDNYLNKYVSESKKQYLDNKEYYFIKETIDDLSIESILLLFKIELSFELSQDGKKINQEFIKQIKNKSIREFEKISNLELNWNSSASKWQPIWKNMNFILKLGIVLFINEILIKDIINYNVESKYIDLLEPENKSPRFTKISNEFKIIPRGILEKHVKIDENISDNNLISYEIINEI